jgi:hypothetical protein
MTVVMAIPAMTVTMLRLSRGGNCTHQDDSGEKSQQRTLHKILPSQVGIVTLSIPGNG